MPQVLSHKSLHVRTYVEKTATSAFGPANADISAPNTSTIRTHNTKSVERASIFLFIRLFLE